MIIRRIVKDVDGNLEATLALTQEQAAFLINMGLVTLVAAGSVSMQDMSPEEFEKAQQAEGDDGITVPVTDRSKLN